MSSKVPAFLRQAATEPITLPISDLLTVWDFRTRSYDNVARIEQDLSTAGLQCIPSFKEGELSTTVCVSAQQASGTPEASSDATPGEQEQDQPLELPSFTLRIGDIPSAVGGIVSVSPDQGFDEARFLMVRHNYSQLPVMAGPRTLKGVITWQTILSAGLGKPDIELKDVIDPYPKWVFAAEELLRLATTIHDAGFVLVRGQDQSVTGIVTGADLANRFGNLTTPFFQLGDIEGKLRRCISRKFNIQEIRDVVKAPRLESVSAMTFGQYGILLQDPARWQRMHWPSVPRGMFVHELDEIRKIRNRVMHFGKQLEDGDREKLTAFLEIMRPLDTHG